jgi:hypothetical protein
MCSEYENAFSSWEEYEFTGSKYPKTKHRFTLAKPPLVRRRRHLARRAGGQGLHHAHNRAGAGNRAGARSAGRRAGAGRLGDWLYLTRSEDELLPPSAVGTLSHQVVRQGLTAAVAMLGSDNVVANGCDNVIERC